MLLYESLWVTVEVSVLEEVSYSFGGLRSILRSGLKKHPDLFTLGDVDRQLNESLWHKGKDKQRLKTGFNECISMA